MIESELKIGRRIDRSSGNSLQRRLRGACILVSAAVVSALALLVVLQVPQGAPAGPGQAAQASEVSVALAPALIQPVSSQSGGPSSDTTAVATDRAESQPEPGTLGAVAAELREGSKAILKTWPPGLLSFRAGVSEMTLKVTNVGPGSGRLTFEPNASWLSIESAQGAPLPSGGQQIVIVRVNRSKLPVGSFETTLDLSVGGFRHYSIDVSGINLAIDRQRIVKEVTAEAKICALRPGQPGTDLHKAAVSGILEPPEDVSVGAALYWELFDGPGRSTQISHLANSKSWAGSIGPFPPGTGEVRVWLVASGGVPDAAGPFTVSVLDC